MTIFDLLAIVVVLTAIGTLVVAAVSAVRGRWRQALGLLRGLAVCTVAYIAIVYSATALSREVVHRIGDPQCSDDWCIAVESAKRTRGNAVVRYDITLRIFSRALRVSQRELAAKDVYLVDAQWRRYDPIRTGAEVPLNTLLQPGESVTTSRRFELPEGVQGLALMLDRGSQPICLVVGECEAFHKGAVMRID